MLENKLNFFGNFYQAKDALTRAHKNIVELWNSGAVRLLSDDIEEITATEREIKGILKQIGAFKELFSGIANNKVVDKEV